MARELPKVYEPQQVENEIYSMWEEKGYFRPQNKEDVFNWRGKGAGQELKKSTRGAAPLPNQKLFDNNKKK